MISGIEFPKYISEAGNAWGSELYLFMHCRHVSNERKGNVEVVRCNLKIMFGQNYRGMVECWAFMLFYS